MRMKRSATALRSRHVHVVPLRVEHARRRRIDITEENAVRLAEELPPPTFDADRRLRQLDEEE